MIDANILFLNQTGQQLIGQADGEPNICYLKTARNHWSEAGSVPDFAFKLKARNKQPEVLLAKQSMGGKPTTRKRYMRLMTRVWDNGIGFHTLQLHPSHHYIVDWHTNAEDGKYLRTWRGVTYKFLDKPVAFPDDVSHLASTSGVAVKLTADNSGPALIARRSSQLGTLMSVDLLLQQRPKELVKPTNATILHWPTMTERHHGTDSTTPQAPATLKPQRSLPQLLVVERNGLTKLLPKILTKQSRRLPDLSVATNCILTHPKQPHLLTIATPTRCRSRPRVEQNPTTVTWSRLSRYVPTCTSNPSAHISYLHC